MKLLKRSLSVFLAAILLCSLFVSNASAATKSGYYGKTAILNSAMTKTVKTVNLNGNADYLYFKYTSAKKSNVYVQILIYGNKNYSGNPVFNTMYECDSSDYYVVDIPLKNFKTKTYYAAIVPVYRNGNSVDFVEKDIYEFTIKVNRAKTPIKNVCVMLNYTYKNTVSGPQIKWTKLSGASKYYIYRKPTTGTKWKKIASVAGTKIAYTDTSLKGKAGIYRYTVRGVDSKGNLSKYNTIGAHVIAVGAPTVSSAAIGTNNRITVKWKAVSGANGYYIYRKTNDGSWKKISTAGKNATSFIDTTSKKSGTKYGYTVRAYIKTTDGKTTLSSYYSGKSLTYIAAPTITAIVGVTGGASLAWKSVKGAASYTVYRRTLEDQKWVNVGTTTDLSITDRKNIVPGEEYIYTVRSEGNGCRGSYYTAGVPVIVPEVTDVYAADDVWDTAKCFNFYKAACDEILNGGIAGYTRKEWQEIQDFKLGSGADGDALLGIIRSFVAGEVDADESVSEKGSDDAKQRMAPCGATLDYVASATKKDQGDNYVITIVMNDEITPAKGSAGIASMSTGILYMEDVVDTIQNGSGVSAIVKGLTDDSKITYKSYTITATMTKDGHFIDINHITTGKIVAGAKLITGPINVSGVLVFHSHWYDFKY